MRVFRTKANLIRSQREIQRRKPSGLGEWIQAGVNSWKWIKVSLRLGIELSIVHEKSPATVILAVRTIYEAQSSSAGCSRLCFNIVSIFLSIIWLCIIWVFQSTGLSSPVFILCWTISVLPKFVSLQDNKSAYCNESPSILLFPSSNVPIHLIRHLCNMFLYQLHCCLTKILVLRRKSVGHGVRCLHRPQ